MSKIITVFGATGNQGGSVVRSILADPSLSKEFKIRGITRDPTKPAAKKLAEQGVELVNADMNDPASVSSAIADSHTVFLVTNYWETANPDTERTQGLNVLRATQEARISHLIFSSLLHVSKTTNNRLTHVPHFDSKADIEAAIRASGVPCSFVLAGYFMSNYFGLLQKGDDGTYTLAYPIKPESKFPLFDAASDTGKFVVGAIKARATDSIPNGARIYAATDYYTVPDILGTWEEVTGHKARFVKVSAEQYKSALPEFMADEMLENHLFIEDPGYFAGADLGESLALLEEKPTTWREFVERNREKWA